MLLPQHILYSPFGFRLGFSVINMAMNSVIKVDQSSGLLTLLSEQLGSRTCSMGRQPSFIHSATNCESI